ncbi:unnamed protein product [Cunninghamella blakesleeana]
MKVSFILLFILPFIQLMNALPMVKRDSLTFSLPTAKSKWVIGRSESVVWASTDNDSVDILLSKDGSSDVIVLANDINVFQGSYVYQVPETIQPNTQWKIVIKNADKIFVSSDVFEIISSSEAETQYEFPPSEQALNDNHWTGSANITLIQPTSAISKNGPEHLMGGGSIANAATHFSSNGPFMMTFILLSITCFYFFI